MTIRPYRATDEAEVMALWRECGMLRWSDPRKDLARKMKVNPEWFLVGEKKNEHEGARILCPTRICAGRARESGQAIGDRLSA